MVVHDDGWELYAEDDDEMDAVHLHIKAILSFLEHPVCRITSSTLICSSLDIATGMALPLPTLPKQRRRKKSPPHPPLAAAVTKWLEEAIFSRVSQEESEDDTEETEDARTLWFRHVDPFIQKCLQGGGEKISLAPLLRFSIEAESIFESRGLVWVRGQTCRDPQPVWILAGARLIIPTRNKIESFFLLAVDSMPVVEFARRTLSPGEKVRRIF